jgi:anaerobic ribonucleoside-triphosphate reductase
MIKVVKRDNRIKEFSMERIKEAIHKAYLDVSDEETFQDEYMFLHSAILVDIERANKEEFNIEEIQDVVIQKLNKFNKKVAKSYKDYRDKRTKEREANTDTAKKLTKILNCNDVLNSNANVDEYSFGGRKFESAGVVLKNYALNYIMKPEIAKAHLENRLYSHDLDSYATGMHNCLNVMVKKLIGNGFSTRNGDVRGASGISTAMQQLAVIFQIQSQEQFGGVGTIHIDYDLEEQVEISLKKYFSDALYYLENKDISWKDLDKEITIENKDVLKSKYPQLMKYALRELEKDGLQSAQGLYHNLNTLESRPGSQVPFTSINYGRRTTEAGRMVTRWLLLASLDGIGKFHRTSIFPISIFQYKKGINDKKDTPNYDLKQLAIKSMSKRIYPNWVNCDWSQNKEDENNPDTVMATMG